MWKNTVTLTYSISKNVVIYDVIPFNKLDRYQYFGWNCQPIFTRLCGATPQKTINLIMSPALLKSLNIQLSFVHYYEQLFSLCHYFNFLTYLICQDDYHITECQKMYPEFQEDCGRLCGVEGICTEAQKRRKAIQNY